MRGNHGYTLLELIATLLVASLLMTLGLPSLTATVRENCVATGANALLAELVEARAAAIGCNCSVAICKSADGTSCSRGATGSWSQNLLTFIDSDHNGTLGSSERVLAVTPPMSCSSLSSNKYLNYVSYNSEGIVNSNGSFFVVANGGIDVSRTVALFSGRVRVCNSHTQKNCSAPS